MEASPSEMEPLQMSRSTYRVIQHEQNQQRRQKYLTWAIIIFASCGVVFVCALLGFIFSGPYHPQTFSPTYRPVLLLMSQAWPISDERVVTSNDKTNKRMIITDTMLVNAFEKGGETLKSKYFLEQRLTDNNITMEEGTPQFYHQTFSATKAAARGRITQGYMEECALKALMERSNVSKKDRRSVLDDLWHKVIPDEYQITTLAVSDCDPPQPYRTADGRCNNLIQKEWGASYTPFRRMARPDYQDGISAPRASSGKTGLPSARVVSTTVHGSVPSTDNSHSSLLMHWGQFVDHDITATAMSKGQNGTKIVCCSDEVVSNKTLRHPECFPIQIPEYDYFYGQFNMTCMEMVRSAPAQQKKFRPRNQLNQLTSFLDLSTIYGSTQEEQNSLRRFSNGSLNFSVVQNDVVLLPTMNDFDTIKQTDKVIIWSKHHPNFFRSGDSRVNEQIVLTALHTLWMREHNRVAKNLALYNPGWDDEKLFQEARRIVIAELQHITYNEYIPEIIGRALSDYLNLTSQHKGFDQSYNSSTNPSIANVFAAAAFRFGHSQIQLIYRGMLDKLMFGQLGQKSGKVDRYFTKQVTNHLFEDLKLPYGLDLVAINIQRGRDHGLRGYNYWRKHCGLPKAHSFQDLKRFHWADDMIEKVSKIYGSVEDIDLYTGGLGEGHIDSGVVGPTFACLIADQFMRLKVGDRFWYETAEKPQAFTEDQLNEIRKMSLARFLCNNVEELLFVSPRPLKLPGKDNLPIRCYRKEIPDMDLRYWQQDPFF